MSPCVVFDNLILLLELYIPYRSRRPLLRHLNLGKSNIPGLCPNTSSNRATSHLSNLCSRICLLTSRLRVLLYCSTLSRILTLDLHNTLRHRYLIPECLCLVLSLTLFHILHPLILIHLLILATVALHRQVPDLPLLFLRNNRYRHLMCLLHRVLSGETGRILTYVS